jgi:tRNA pseudouridine55 synthase
VVEVRGAPATSLETTAPLDVLDVDISVRCSSGTYIRAIARDLGTHLGVGGHLTALRRTAVGPFTLGGACTLDDVRVTPIAEAARAAFPAVDLTDAEATDVGFGRRIQRELGELSALFAPDGTFLALYRPDGDGARAEAVFVR